MSACCWFVFVGFLSVFGIRNKYDIVQQELVEGMLEVALMR